jgi:signal transduction histidine kinase
MASFFLAFLAFWSWLGAPNRKLRTPAAGPRRPGEPFAGPVPWYEEGHAPGRLAAAARRPASTAPTGVGGHGYAARGTQSPGGETYADGMDANAARSLAATFVTDTTSPPPPRHRRLRRGRFDLVEVADVITAFICFLVANSWLTDHQHARHGGVAASAGVLILIAFVTSAPLVLRSRFPLTAWAASALSIVGTDVVLPPHSLSSSAYLPTSALVYELCLYAVTVRCKPRVTIAATFVTVLGAAVIDWRSFAGAFFLTVIPLLLGAVVRTWRSGQRRLAEQERRHSGERALFEERQRIARELHDVVAHHMSVIAIQAEAAPYKTAAPPPELVECFGEIRASALTGLTELRRVLGVLRTDRPDTAPQPGLADLEALLGSARGGGLSVTAATSGNPVPLPDGVDLSAYRIVQEALSNAMRHAPGSHVTVRVSYGGDQLGLDVRNDARPRAAGPAPTGLSGDRGGHGIIGMRERAAMLGGSLHTGPTEDGGFGVTAVLPVSADRPKDDA